MSELIPSVIREAAGKAPWKVLFCYNCSNVMATRYEQDFQFTWSLKLHCDNCNSSWWVCRLCSKQHAHMSSKAKASRHHRLKHAASNVTSNHDEIQDDNGFLPDVTNTDSDSEEQPILSHFGRKESIQYFTENLQADGAYYLAAKAVLHDSSKRNNLDTGDVVGFIATGHLVASVSRTQRELLAIVLNNCVKCTLQNHPNMVYVPKPAKRTKVVDGREIFKLDIPTTKEKMRHFYIKGKDSLFNNLPHPNFENISGHACCKPSECLADIMAHGRLDFRCNKKSVQSLGESPTAIELQIADNEFGCKSVFLSLWSDDFEPNYSTKSKGSVWMMTMTIQTNKSGNPNYYCVYPIIIGDSSWDHGPAVKYVLDDIKRMKRKRDRSSTVRMWNAATGENQTISAHLIAVVQDQPERRKFNGLLTGGSGSHPRWGWRASVLENHEEIVSCPACRWDLVHSCLGGFKHGIERCDDCLNWMTRTDSMLTTRVPDLDYEEDDLTEGKLLFPC